MSVPTPGIVVALPIVNVVPLAAALVTLNELLSGSKSLVRMFPVIVFPAGAAIASSLAYTSLVVFADKTVTNTDADAVPPFPSEMV